MWVGVGRGWGSWIAESGAGTGSGTGSGAESEWPGPSSGWPGPGGRVRVAGTEWSRHRLGQQSPWVVENRTERSQGMGLFVAHELGLELVRSLGRVLPRIARRDKDLARQLKRSAASVVLNLAEGTHSDPGNRQARYASAAGSAKETQSALVIAEAWGYHRGPRPVSFGGPTNGNNLPPRLRARSLGARALGLDSSASASPTRPRSTAPATRPRPLGLGTLPGTGTGLGPGSRHGPNY